MKNSHRPYKGIYPTLSPSTFVDPSSIIIGDVRLAEDSSIWPLVVARGDVNHIHIGLRSNIQDGSILHVSRPSKLHPNGFPLIIGDDVTVGHKAMLHGCTIGQRVLIGMGSIILDGAIIEDEVMIGAGSLVPPGKRLESGFLYMGSPIKKARPLTDNERAFLLASASNYVQLKNDYIMPATD
ncbi:anhydrase [Photobacterium aquae]|uniref:Anhydrase n=1 Tax=Photobacterium aquae TaxID=1195763 RepID=A0A0J1JM71_9GAMM|nr:gamma carbonic anhydrase family protein [Photobacterium aquae]KLV03252.1 anhydrase [Photobacterium aquae]